MTSEHFADLWIRAALATHRYIWRVEYLAGGSSEATRRYALTYPTINHADIVALRIDLPKWETNPESTTSLKGWYLLSQLKYKTRKA